MTDGAARAGVVGLVLAAGSGRRMGGPKALARTPSGELLLDRAVRTVRAGGCAQVVVALGAGADEARAQAQTLVEPGTTVVEVTDHGTGMAASLRSGLGAAEGLDPDAVVITLVDLPDVTPDVVARVVGEGPHDDALRRATYDGRPGHPVLLGRVHVTPFVESLLGDEGGRRYLVGAGCEGVPCADLATGQDVDTPEELGRAR